MLLSGPRHTQVVTLSVVPGGDDIGPEHRNESLRVVVGRPSADSARIPRSVGDGAPSGIPAQLPEELPAEPESWNATRSAFGNDSFIENSRSFPTHVQDATSTDEDAATIDRTSSRGSHRGSRQCWGRFVEMLTCPGGSRTRLLYPLRFRALVAVVVGLSAMWLSNYLFVVMPALEEPDLPCKYDDNQLRYNAQILFVYFAWFIIARLSLFLPCVASRVVWVHSRTHGFCHAYCVHLLLRDGPLYIFVMGSLLFWFHLMQSPVCEERSPSFYKALKLYAIYSNLVSVFCLVLGHWHNRILADAAGDPLIHDNHQRAPPGTIHKLQSCPYDEAVFGDEEGKLYPSECAICLGSWEADDSIKVTPCSHAFHEECIGNWLQNARTCALCREDLAALTSAVPLPEQVGATRTRQGAVGVEDV